MNPLVEKKLLLTRRHFFSLSRLGLGSENRDLPVFVAMVSQGTGVPAWTAPLTTTFGEADSFRRNTNG